MNDDDFNDLVRRAYMGRISAEEEEYLLSHEAVERYYDRLRYVVGNINGQLAAYKEAVANGERPEDPHWRRRAAFVKRRADDRILAVAPALKEARRRRARSDAHVLRHAIAEHRVRTLATGEDPTTADLELWALIADPERVGAS